MTDAHPLGEGTWATHSLTRLGRPLRKFLGVRCGCFLGFGSGAVGLNLFFPALALYGGSEPNYGCPPIRGRVPGLPIVLPGWGDPSSNFWGSGAVFRRTDVCG